MLLALRLIKTATIGMVTRNQPAGLSKNDIYIIYENENVIQLGDSILPFTVIPLSISVKIRYIWPNFYVKRHVCYR